MNKHFYLQNHKKEYPSYNRKRNFTKKEDNDEEKLPKIISQAKIGVLRSNYRTYNNDKERRDSNRTLDLPIIIDLIRVSFHKVFNYELQKLFFSKYGLIPIDYTDFNQTVLFEIDDVEAFKSFKSHLKLIIDSNEPVEYSGQDYNLIALIQSFSFFEKRLKTSDTDGLIMTLIPKSSGAVVSQIERLLAFLDENQINFEIDEAGELIYIKEISSDNLNIISGNFDVVKGIISSRPLTVRPGILGTLRMEYGFEVDKPENLPVIGIIDTGVNDINPLRDLIVGTINITGETDSDLSGHGTLVAGLATFGEAFSFSVEQTYKAKCKLLPIKIIHRNTDPIDFASLLKAIREARLEYGVRIFNMSVVFGYIKNYNEAYSDFAYELDKLAYELDVLLFISVGNFDAESLRSLLQEDYIEDHSYPNFFYKLETQSEVHNCENTNIAVPSESLNNISVGALAGNIEDGENSDITPLNIYPAYYTRKFHFDYNQEVNGKNLQRNQKNKHLNKPDLVFDGGDYFKYSSGIEVLTSDGEFYTRTAGTSLATPLITSMAAEILTVYPYLNIQSIKALLINSTSYFTPSHIPVFKEKKKLLHKLIGFGKPRAELLTQSTDNSITFIIEDDIKSGKIMALPIYLPEYLKNCGNKLIFNITIAYKFNPKKGGHLDYLPLNISFTLIQNLPIKDIAMEKLEFTRIKNGFGWSEDNFGIENCLFSNTQNMKYSLQPNDLKRLDGEIAIAVRSLVKSGVEDNDGQAYPFSIVVRIEEELKNKTEFNLYNEMTAINELEVIGDLEGEAEADID